MLSAGSPTLKSRHRVEYFDIFYDFLQSLQVNARIAPKCVCHEHFIPHRWQFTCNSEIILKFYVISSTCVNFAHRNNEISNKQIFIDISEILNHF